MKTAREILTVPMTAKELSAMLECTLKQAHARLHALKKKGAAVKTDRLVPNGNTSKGAHNSALWLRIK